MKAASQNNFCDCRTIFDRLQSQNQKCFKTWFLRPSPIWGPYGTHMGVESFPCTFSRTVLEHKTIYECFQIIKSFLLDIDTYKTNNSSHKNKKSLIQLLLFQSVPFTQVPYGTHMGPIWVPYGSKQKLVRQTYLKPYIKKYLMKFFCK